MLAGPLSGYASPGAFYSTNVAGQVLVEFTSDASVANDGFTADLECVAGTPAPTPPATTCAGTGGPADAPSEIHWLSSAF